MAAVLMQEELPRTIQFNDPVFSTEQKDWRMFSAPINQLDAMHIGDHDFSTRRNSSPSKEYLRNSPPFSEHDGPSIQVTTSPNVPTYYEGWTLKKDTSRLYPGECASWCRVQKTELAIPTNELINRVKNQISRGKGSPLKDYKTLRSDNQRAQIDTLLAEKRRTERNPYAEWILASVEDERGALTDAWGTETKALHIILKKQRKSDESGDCKTASGTRRRQSMPAGAIVDLSNPLSQSFGTYGSQRPQQQTQVTEYGNQGVVEQHGMGFHGSQQPQHNLPLGGPHSRQQRPSHAFQPSQLPQAPMPPGPYLQQNTSPGQRVGLKQVPPLQFNPLDDRVEPFNKNRNPSFSPPRNHNTTPSASNLVHAFDGGGSESLPTPKTLPQLQGTQNRSLGRSGQSPSRNYRPPPPFPEESIRIPESIHRSGDISSKISHTKAKKPPPVPTESTRMSYRQDRRDRSLACDTDEEAVSYGSSPTSASSFDFSTPPSSPPSSVGSESGKDHRPCRRDESRSRQSKSRASRHHGRRHSEDDWIDVEAGAERGWHDRDRHHTQQHRHSPSPPRSSRDVAIYSPRPRKSTHDERRERQYAREMQQMRHDEAKRSQKKPRQARAIESRGCRSGGGRRKSVRWSDSDDELVRADY